MSDPCSRELLPFSQVKIGDAFVLPTHLGIAAGPYFKTGPESYGIAPNEPIWQWENECAFVERCFIGSLLEGKVGFWVEQ